MTPLTPEQFRAHRAGLPIPPLPTAAPATTPVESVTPTSIPTPAVAVPAGGYLRILPPGVATINDLAPDFRAKYWAGPSPYCRVEGVPDHPEFENNLTACE